MAKAANAISEPGASLLSCVGIDIPARAELVDFARASPVEALSSFHSDREERPSTRLA